MSGPTSLPSPIGPKTAPTLSHGNSPTSIDNSFIAGHGVCQDGEKSSRCFLDDAVRGRLYAGVEGRVSRAAAMVTAAIAKLRIDEMVKEPPDLDPITDLLIDVATAFLGKLAGKAIKSLRGKPASTLIELGVGGVLLQESEDKTKEADEGAVGLAIKGATSLAKKGAGKVANAEDKAEYEADKAAALSYLALLQNGVFAALDAITTQGYGSMGDADRILTYEMLGPKYLTPDAVEADIAAALKRYQSSPASKIGRATADRHMEKPAKGSSLPDVVAHQQKEIAAKKIDSVNDVRSTKLVQQVYSNGEPPRLFYYKRDFDGGITSAPGGDAFLNTEVEYPEHAAKDDHYVMYREVEPEFMQIAIANNMQQWNKPYDVEIVAVPDRMKEAASYKPPAPTPPTPPPLDARPPA